MKNVVLITGASGAIGGGIARLLHKDGYPLALQYNSNGEAIEHLCSELNAETPYLSVKADISDETEVNAMFDSIETRLGRVCTLINCAGIALQQKLLTDCTAEEYHSVFDVNVLGTLLCSRQAIPNMVSNREGCIINLSSVWGLVGGSCEVIYSASKAAVIGLTKALSRELAHSNIRVNCIAPGFVLSNMNAHLSTDEVESIRCETPLQRLITPEDIGEAVRYIMSAEAVTGQILSIDGGFVG